MDGCSGPAERKAKKVGKGAHISQEGEFEPSIKRREKERRNSGGPPHFPYGGKPELLGNNPLRGEEERRLRNCGKRKGLQLFGIFWGEHDNFQEKKRPGNPARNLRGRGEIERTRFHSIKGGKVERPPPAQRKEGGDCFKRMLQG